MTDSQKFLKEEEAKLLDWVEEEAARRKRREALDRARALPKFELAERQTIADAAVSGDGKFAFLVMNERAQSRASQVPRYVSESAFTEEINARTKVGDTQDRRRLAILNLESGEASGPGSTASAIRSRFRNRRTATSRGRPRSRTRRQSATCGGDRRCCRRTAASRWCRCDPPTTPSAGWPRSIRSRARRRFSIASRTMRGCVTAGRGGCPTTSACGSSPSTTAGCISTPSTPRPGQRQQLTSGKFEIDSVELSPDGRTFYIQSNEAHPGERHLYAMSVDGGPRTRITTEVGGASRRDLSGQLDVRPGVVVCESSARSVRDGESRRRQPTRVTTSPSKEWMAHKWVEPQLVTYKARDGADVYARLYTPEMVGAKRDPKAPAVIFVHGAGYLQNAHKFWSSYYREYMFHHLLAARGYVVLDPDYRASAGYGRDWRTSIYRWMGGHDLNDVVDGAAYLVKSHKVDAKRIGVYGGSYGGFITLMALFTSPDTFAAGAALRPGDRLGALQPSIHLEHPQRAARRMPRRTARARRSTSRKG